MDNIEKEFQDFGLLGLMDSLAVNIPTLPPELLMSNSPVVISPLQHPENNNEYNEMDFNGSMGKREGDVTAENCTGARERIPTAKGKEFETQKRKENRKYALSNITRQMNKIKPLLSNLENERIVQIEMVYFDQLVIKFQEVHERYIEILEDEHDIDLAQEWYSIHDKEIFHFKQSVVDFQNSVKEKYANFVETQSHISQGSRRSRTSSASRAKFIEAKARAAALEIKAAFLKEKQALRIASEELQLKQELAEAKIAERIYEQYENEQDVRSQTRNECFKKDVPAEISSAAMATKEVPHTVLSFPNSIAENINTSQVISSKSQDNPAPFVANVTTSVVTPIVAHQVSEGSALHPSASRWVPTPPHTMKGWTSTPAAVQTADNFDHKTSESTQESFIEVQRKQNELSELIVKHQTRSQLPSHKPPVFAGDVMEYPAFIRAFETLIESKVESPIECLYFLEQYTNGKAKELIKGCMQIKSEDSYKVAKQLLKKHFGNPFKIASAYIAKLCNWPAVKPNDGASLQQFSIALEQARNAMMGIAYMSDLNTTQVLRQLWEKLPRYLRVKWCERSNRIANAQSRIAEFADFVEFVAEQADLATDPIYSEDTIKVQERRERPTIGGRKIQRSKGSSFATNVSSVNNSAKVMNTGSSCLHCSSSHDIDECPAFKAKSLADRRNFIKERNLCYGCYNTGHTSKNCKRKRSCKICNRKHPTLLHDYDWKPSLQESPKNTSVKNSEGDKDGKSSEVSLQSNVTKFEGKVNNACTAICDETEVGDVIPVSMGIVPVWLYHKSNPDKKIQVYALLDNASGGTFVKAETLQKLGMVGSETTILLGTLHGSQEVDTKAVDGLVAVHFRQRDAEVSLPRTYVRKEIPVDRAEIPRPEIGYEWPHLQPMRELIPAHMEDVEVGLLIGLNCPRAVRPREVIHGNEDGPYAVRSLLGWYVNGPVCSRGKTSVNCNRIQVKEADDSVAERGYITIERAAKEVITPQAVSRMFEVDFSERESGTGMSQEDRRFIKKAEEGIRHCEDNHYEMPLPFKSENIQLPNNREQALQRLNSLKKRLQTDRRYHDDYTAFMSNLIEKGHAVKVAPERLKTQAGKVWYIPHHGIYHPQKPHKIRVVFDCSAKYQGESINDNLLQGPNLTNQMIGVLTKFRKEKIAFMGDMEKMFYQVRVRDQDRDFLRFMWWPDGNLNNRPEEYYMTVHLFGGVSSPGCANFTLRRTAQDNEREFGNEAADTLKKNFYVDDALKSVENEEKAIKLLEDVKTLCARGGFNLTKFVSNSRKVLESVPPEHRADNVKDLDLCRERLPIERALGLHWCIESDTFKFRIELKNQPCTRRGILSTLSSIYDPLGFIAPVVLIGKQILQDICQECSWDEPVPDDIQTRWNKWRRELTCLDQLNVPRCFKPPDFSRVVSAQLHSLSDASTKGYGQCSYIRLVDEQNKIHCALVAGKTRVSPKKTVSIPRLELAAATTSVKVADALKKELEYEGLEEFYWTDSQVVLSFISNEARRFHVYVANRVQVIRDLTSPDSWRFVESASNPADEGSRGLMPRKFVEQSQWIRGPEFLWQSEEQWPQQPSCKPQLDDDSPEVKKVTVHANSVQERSNVLQRLERFSKWTRARVAIAWCLKYKQQLKNTIKKDHQQSRSPVTVSDLKQAETEIIKLTQTSAFERDIALLKDIETQVKGEGRKLTKDKKSVMKSSTLYKLDPYLDPNGILRVGGRLRRAAVDDTIRNPVILPKSGHVTALIIRHYHEATQHSGRGITLNELRANGYWVVSGGHAIRSLLAKCVRCRFLRGNVGEQKMADLPDARLQAAPPFTYSAVDYFGPWHIRIGRKEVKRYGALFTCLSSRAVHIEVAHSLEADSFIQALRRFVARRGPIRQLYSDHGTNLVGAENELKKAVDEMDEDKIRSELLKNDIDWIKNPPTASHFGGAWERQIRSVRNILAALMKEHGSRLDEESLTTFICEAEAVINSRPLTVDTINDPLSPIPLSPSMLLTGKSKIVLPPPGKFQTEDMYCRKRWRRVQHLMDQFWNRWKTEYLQNIQTRPKWQRKRRNFVSGDIVLVKDSDTSRSQWPLAKVIDTHPDDKGFVRSVTVYTSKGSTLDRPIAKLVLLLEAEQGKPGIPDEEP